MKLADYDRAALTAASHAGGEYLDGLGITDMARLTRDQWLEFLGCVVEAYLESLRLQAEKAMIPDPEASKRRRTGPLPDDGLEFIV